MKILYVAKHDSGGNDDEGAVAWALTRLGHSVQSLQERYGEKAPMIVEKDRVDLVLFHKWLDVPSLQRIKCKKAFWYFDLVEWPADPTLAKRSAARREWMAAVLPHVDFGFCTDGDWVDKDTSGKLRWLCQGADERICGKLELVKYDFDVLFTGLGVSGGVRRGEFVERLQQVYGERFLHVRSGIHRRQLQELIGRCRVVVAPWSPVTDRYWSNRVYNALGFGACLVHPWCEILAKQYVPGKHLSFYRTPSELLTYVNNLLTSKPMRDDMGAAGLRHTLAEHTYRRRCEMLIDFVSGRDER